jgi:hypothetical protein
MTFSQHLPLATLCHGSVPYFGVGPQLSLYLLINYFHWVSIITALEVCNKFNISGFNDGRRHTRIHVVINQYSKI